MQAPEIADGRNGVTGQDILYLINIIPHKIFHGAYFGTGIYRSFKLLFLW